MNILAIVLLSLLPVSEKAIKKMEAENARTERMEKKVYTMGDVYRYPKIENPDNRKISLSEVRP